MFFGFENVTVRYGRKTILEDVTMDFRKGSITTITGLNGTGKTSLLRTVTRVMKPASGRVVLEDRDLYSYNPRARAQRIACLSQVHTTPSDIDVRTLVSYGRYPYRRFGSALTAEDNAIIDSVLESTGLTDLAGRSVPTLSGGESQKAWIAMALAQRPQVLVMDEPTTYLDINCQIEVLDLVRKLNRDMGLTVVMVLHDLNMASRYSDYLYVIGNSRVLAQGTPGTVITEDNLLSLFHINAEVFCEKESSQPFFIPCTRKMEDK